LKSWFLYLKLIHTALNKLPSQQVKVWRGLGQDVSAGYRKGMRLTWASMSSCSNDAGVVQNFLNKKAHSTLFTIDCINGKSITKYSAIASEHEVILMPGTQLKIAGNLLEFNGLHIVHLEELPNPNIQRKYSVLPGIKNSESPGDRKKYTSAIKKLSSVEQKKDKCKYFDRKYL